MTKNDKGAATTFAPCRVLIADDEHLVATGIAAHVRELGHKVVGIAADGEAAVALAREQSPTLALLDIRMPKASGVEAAMVLYQELGIPSIIISAYSDEEHISRIQSYGPSSGVYGYLLKPVSRDELRVTIGVAQQRASVDDANSTRIGQLEQNLQNRRVVEQAKWVLVQKSGMTEPQAHEKLQKVARDRRRPLIEIAQAVIQSGDLLA
ncbi:MAG: response regulator [Phycisphaerales bacterium]|nr:response regulator [Phycisphaerales bacterium]